MRTLRVMVNFYPNKRNSFPPLNYGYRPHFVVNGDSELLGIEFSGCDLKEYSVFGEAVVKLLYENVGYHKLEKGVCFKIVEGSTAVGEGYVLDYIKYI